MTTTKFFAVSALLLTAGALSAQTVELNGVKYELDASTHTAAASYADADMKHAVVVETVSYEGVDYTVTALADRAFFGCRGLQTISLPATLTSAGTFAFLGCFEMERVDIPTLADWLEISFKDGFANPLVNAHNLYVGGDLLENVVLPEGLEKVPDNAFVGASITSVEFPASVTEIGTLAFYECESLEVFEAGANLATIATQAFDACSALKTVVLSPAVTEVGSYAFNDCSSLATVTFGPQVASVGADAFAGCQAVEAVEAADIASWCRIDFANDAANPLKQAHVLRVGGEVVTVLEIPAGITEVKAGAFAGCTALESVVIGANVTEVGANAFNSCPALKSVRFDGPVTAIGESAFEACANLSECELPESLNQVGRYSFYGTSLCSVSVPEGVTALPDGVFGECEQLAAVELPEGLLSLGFGCFYECTALEEIDLPQTLQKIGKSAFYGCRALKIVKIGKDQASISAFAFASCPAITDIYVAAIEPPVAPESVFSDYSATLHVPQGTIEAYAADSTWGLFTDIEAYDSGVSAVCVPVNVVIEGNTVNFGPVAGSVVEIVTLDGRVIYHGAPAPVTLAPGTYIIHTPSTTLKVNI